MAQSLAVIDTSVLVLLLSKPGPAETEAVRIRRERAELVLSDLRKEGAVFIVPTPVIAELYRGGSGSEIIRKKLVRHLRRTKIEVLSASAADVAGQMSKKALEERPPGEVRGAVKYDALIAAIAHDIGARWLVTDNRADMQRCLDAVNSPVELVVTSAIPKKGQLSLVHIQPTADPIAVDPRASSPQRAPDAPVAKKTTTSRARQREAQPATASPSPTRLHPGSDEPSGNPDGGS